MDKVKYTILGVAALALAIYFWWVVLIVLAAALIYAVIAIIWLAIALWRDDGHWARQDAEVRARTAEEALHRAEQEGV